MRRGGRRSGRRGNTVARRNARHIYVDGGYVPGGRPVGVEAPHSTRRSLADSMRLDEVEIRLEPIAPGEPNRVYLTARTSPTIREPEVHVSETPGTPLFAAPGSYVPGPEKAASRMTVATSALSSARCGRCFLVADVDVRAKRRWNCSTRGTP